MTRNEVICYSNKSYDQMEFFKLHVFAHLKAPCNVSTIKNKNSKLRERSLPKEVTMVIFLIYGVWVYLHCIICGQCLLRSGVQKTYGCTMQGEDFKFLEMKTISHKFVIWLTKNNIVFNPQNKDQITCHILLGTRLSE